MSGREIRRRPGVTRRAEVGRAAVNVSGEEASGFRHRRYHRAYRLSTQTDSTVTITFTAPEAGSAGVQYVTGASGQPMADCYVAEAQRADGLGKVTLTGLTPGQVISYRVYAARTAGVYIP